MSGGGGGAGGSGCGGVETQEAQPVPLYEDEVE